MRCTLRCLFLFFVCAFVFSMCAESCINRLSRHEHREAQGNAITQNIK